LKSQTKVIVVILAVTAAALAIIGCQAVFGGKSDSYKSVSAAELVAIVENMPEMQKRQFAQNEQQRKELIKQVKQLFSLATAAQAGGMEKTDQFKRQMALQIDTLLAGEENKRHPQETIPKQERDAYLAAHGKDFEDDLKIITAGSNQGPPPDQMEGLKDQWAEMKLRAEKARRAGLDKDPNLQLQLKLQRAQMLAQAYARSLQEKFKPSPEDLKKYYEEHPEADMEGIKKRAEGILARIKQGEDFATLAKQYSDDKTSGEKGGELGWVGKGTWVPEFEEAAFAMQPGQISDLVKSGYGFHIIKLEERRTVEKPAPAATPSTAEKGPQAEAGPREEVKARHILISTREAEGVEQMLAQKRIQRAMEDATLNHPVTAPADFTLNVPGILANPGLKLPGRGSGQGGHMAPINPNK
jgi:parvulin-like peptidyl-prolyl isomerase